MREVHATVFCLDFMELKESHNFVVYLRKSARFFIRVILLINKNWSYRALGTDLLSISLSVLRKGFFRSYHHGNGLFTNFRGFREPTGKNCDIKVFII